MPSGGQFAARPMQPMQPMQPMGQNFQGYPSFRDAAGQPTFCAFMPNDGAHFPAYYEQTTTAAPTTSKNDDWRRRKSEKGDENSGRERKFRNLFLKYFNQVKIIWSKFFQPKW